MLFRNSSAFCFSNTFIADVPYSYTSHSWKTVNKSRIFGIQTDRQTDSSQRLKQKRNVVIMMMMMTTVI